MESDSVKESKADYGVITCLGVLAVIPSMLVLGIVGGLLRTVVVRDGWGWFATPAFGVSVPTFWTTFGLLLLLSVIWPRVSERSKSLVDMIVEWSSGVLLVLTAWGLMYAVYRLGG